MNKQGLLILLFGCFVLVARLLLSPSEQANIISERAAGVRKRTLAPEDVLAEELRIPFTQRVLAPVLDSLAALVQRALPGTMISRLRLRLIEAGRPYSVERFVSFKLLASVMVFGVYTALVIPQTPEVKRPFTMLLAIVSSLLAFNLPDFWLSTRTDARKLAVKRHLADVLDLLSVSVEAGLGFDGAVQKVAEKFAEPVSSEFKSYLAEVRLGKSRAEALRNLARRTNLPEMHSFVASIIQADHLGVRISTVLRVQSESLRTRRRQHAEERAMQAPVKMLFPLIFCIFPTLFLVLLGPVAIHWITTFNSVPK